MFPRILPRVLLPFVLALVAHAAPPADGVVVFNELMYNPAGMGEEGEWIEITNLMGVSVDLSSWRVEGGIEFTIPENTVLAGGAHLVVAKTPATIPDALPVTATVRTSVMLVCAMLAAP